MNTEISVHKTMDFYITDQKVVRLSIVSNGDGKKYLDIRQFYTDRNTDELKPTQKGIWIPLEDKEASAKRILFEGLKFLGMDKNEMATFLDEDELLGENS